MLAALFAFASTHIIPALAAPNLEVNYQGKLTDSAGSAVADGDYDMEFNLYTVPTGGTAIWTESRTGADQVSTISGLFSVMLGDVTSLASVDFNQTLYLGVTVGADSEMTPRKIIGTVPAAFVAEDANNAALLGGVASSSFLRSDVADTATGLLTFLNGFLSNASSTIAALTTNVATTTTLVINNEAFTDLTGSYLSNSAGVLTVDTGSLSTLFDTQYASTTDFDTSAELAAILGDETGTGSVVFSASPTFTGTSIFNQLTATATSTFAHATASSLSVSGLTTFNGVPYLFPSADGAASQVLTTNGAGGLSWSTVASGGGGDPVVPSFSVRKTSSQSIASGATAKVTWDTEEFDTNGNFDLANNRFQPSVAGKYLLTAGAGMAMSAATRHYVMIYKNGVLIAEGSRTIDGGSGLSGRNSVASIVVDANGTSDYFEVYVTQDDSVSRDVVATDSRTYFTGARIDGSAANFAYDNGNLYYASGTAAIGTSTPQTDSTFTVQGLAGDNITQFLTTSGTSALTISETGTTTVSNLVVSGGLTLPTASINESNLNIAGSPTDGYYLQASSTAPGGFIWAAAASHDAVTLAGAPDYLTLSGQEITLNKLDLIDDLNTFSSANLASLLTDETGTGSAVFSASPTFTGTTTFAHATSATLSVSGATTFNSVSYLWPGADGTSGQTLTTDGAGNLSWASVTSGGSDPVVPAFSVHKNGTNQNIAHLTDTKLTWSTEDFDTNSDFDLANNRFQPSVAGKYLLTARAQFVTPTNSVVHRFVITIRKNGTEVASYTKFSTGYANESPSLPISAVVDANGTTDYFEVYVDHNTGSTEVVTGSSLQTAFSGARIDGSASNFAYDNGNLYYASGTAAIGTSTPQTDTTFTVQGLAGDNIFRLFDVSGNTDLLVTETGNVGIGTTTPSQTLTISGDAFITGRLFDSNESAGTSGYILQTTGTGTQWVATSSLGLLSSASIDTSAELAAVLTDETGTGSVVFSNTPTIEGPAIFTGNIQVAAVSLAGTLSEQVNDETVRISGGNVSSDGGELLLYGSDHATSPDQIRLLNNGNTSMTLLQNGNVGIGTVDPGRPLEVNGAGYFTSHVYVGSDANTNPATNNTIGGILNSDGFISANRAGSISGFFGRTNDGQVVGFYSAGNLEGSVSVSGTTVSYNAFTGSHYATTDETIDRGELVAFTGEQHFKYEDSGAEPTYEVIRTTEKNQKNVLGAMLALSEPLQPHSYFENPYLIMAVGNGDIWVTDNGEDIEPGDYLITSDVPGHAEKDRGEFAVAHVVARAAQKVDWDEIDESVDGVKHAKISVTFEQFDKLHGVFFDETTGYASLERTLDDETASSTATSTTPQLLAFTEFATQKDGLWSRAMELARGFVDGVLSVLGLTTETLCLSDAEGQTCVDRDDLRDLLQSAGVSGTETSYPAPSEPEDPESTPATDTGTSTATTSDTTTSTSTNEVTSDPENDGTPAEESGDTATESPAGEGSGVAQTEGGDTEPAPEASEPAPAEADQEPEPEPTPEPAPAPDAGGDGG